jgi:N-dimethylarginine dimethylaminohydrolase
MSLSCHSETGVLKKVYLKSITKGFRNQDEIDRNWQSLNFIARPDFHQALEEYTIFEDILRESGAEISYFEDSDETGMDSIYCRDASIATDFGMIICRMGKPLRSGEPNAQKQVFEKNGEKILGVIEAPGKLEGGDVAWIDRNTLAVAHGYRTNSNGFMQMEAMLSPHGINLKQVPLPHYKGPNDVFHLMSIFSPVADDLAVVYSQLMPVFFRELLIERGYQFVEVPEEEFESMGCNVLALSPRKCVMVEGNPITKSRLENAGCHVIEYKGEHISILGGGGPTCLTRPLLRFQN